MYRIRYSASYDDDDDWFLYVETYFSLLHANVETSAKIEIL